MLFDKALEQVEAVFHTKFGLPLPDDWKAELAAGAYELRSAFTNHKVRRVLAVDGLLETVYGWWEAVQEARVAYISDVFTRFDANGDGVLSLQEFETLLSHLVVQHGQEKRLEEKRLSTVRLYQEALEDTGLDADQISAAAFAALVLRHGLLVHVETEVPLLVGEAVAPHTDARRLKRGDSTVRGMFDPRVIDHKLLQNST